MRRGVAARPRHRCGLVVTRALGDPAWVRAVSPQGRPVAWALIMGLGAILPGILGGIAPKQVLANLGRALLRLIMHSIASQFCASTAMRRCQLGHRRVAGSGSCAAQRHGVQVGENLNGDPRLYPTAACTCPEGQRAAGASPHRLTFLIASLAAHPC